MGDDLVMWLRRQIRLQLTLAAVKPLVDLQGNVPVPPAPAYRQYVDGEPWVSFTRDSLIRHLVTSGVLVTSESPEAWFGDWPMGDLTPLMAPADPRDTISRCEAELAILDEHSPGEIEPEACRRCKGSLAVPCRTVRLLGSGYKHRPGWEIRWAK
jgi:Family of unknown function (DUF6221)